MELRQNANTLEVADLHSPSALKYCSSVNVPNVLEVTTPSYRLLNAKDNTAAASYTYELNHVHCATNTVHSFAFVKIGTFSSVELGSRMR
jgi:hypothetical protein